MWIARAWPMMLRLYRNYSIKIMLAWETCCRFNPPSPPLPFAPCVDILIPAGLGSGILFSYPQLATLAGVQGVVVYALTSALPLLIFAYLGPIIRRKCPEGFVLTEWTRQRYGIIAMLYLSFMTLVTLFLYMVSELSAIGQVINALTGLDGLPVVIVECAVTTVYTCTSVQSSSRRVFVLCAVLVSLDVGKCNLLTFEEFGSSRRLQDLFHHR